MDPFIRSSRTTRTMTAFIVSTFNEYYRKPSLYTAKTMIFVIITDLDVAILKNCQKMYPNILNITLQIHHMLLARTCLVGVPLMRMKQVGSYWILSLCSFVAKYSEWMSRGVVLFFIIYSFVFYNVCMTIDGPLKDFFLFFS